MRLNPLQRWVFIPWASGVLIMLAFLIVGNASPQLIEAEDIPYVPCTGQPELPVAHEPNMPPVEVAYRPVITWPYFPGCQDVAGADKRACSERRLNEYLHSHTGYPSGKLTHRTAGNAVVKLWIGPSGRIQSYRILQAPGFGRFEDADRVINGMMSEGITWEPATADGKPVLATKLVTIHYNMVWVGGKDYY